MIIRIQKLVKYLKSNNSALLFNKIQFNNLHSFTKNNQILSVYFYLVLGVKRDLINIVYFIVILLLLKLIIVRF